LATPVLEHPPPFGQKHPHLLHMSMSWLLAGALPPVYSRPQKAHSPSNSGVGKRSTPSPSPVRKMSNCRPVERHVPREAPVLGALPLGRAVRLQRHGSRRQSILAPRALVQGSHFVPPPSREQPSVLRGLPQRVEGVDPLLGRRGRRRHTAAPQVSLLLFARTFTTVLAGFKCWRRVRRCCI
jgi:hypothetical protein